MTNQTKGTAVITGASTGIGAIYADRLARQGYDVLLVARSESKLKAVAERITAGTGRKATVLVADLTKAADIRKVEDVLRSDVSIQVLVNNAGTGAVMPLVATSAEAMEELIAINVTALTRLTYAVVPQFVSRGEGTLINISSAMAFAPEILNGVYGASKAFVLALTQSLQHEVGDKGVRVQAVLPGATATDFWSNAGNPVENLPAAIVMQADAMVDAALKGLERGEVITVPGLHDGEKWDQFETSRRQLAQLIGNSVPAPRYN